jgi:hypothetical protein
MLLHVSEPRPPPKAARGQVAGTYDPNYQTMANMDQGVFGEVFMISTSNQ